MSVVRSLVAALRRAGPLALLAACGGPASTALVDTAEEPAPPLELRPAGPWTAVVEQRVHPRADGDSFGPSISADGRFVAFVTMATNLAPEEEGFDGPRALLVDRERGTMRRAGPLLDEPRLRAVR